MKRCDCVMKRKAILGIILTVSILMCTGCASADENTEIQVVEDVQEEIEESISTPTPEVVKEEKFPNQLYAEYDGKIYFRRYSAEDKVPGELFGNFRDVEEVTEKDLMCMDSEGNVEKIGTDSGIGTMLIFDGYLYSAKRDVTDSGYLYNQVYSCKLDGTEEINYESTDVVGMLGSYLVCTGKEKKLFIIDTVTREEKLLTSGADEYLFTADNQVYFVSYPEVTEAVIYRVTADGVKSEIARMTVDDLKKISETEANYISVVCSQIAGNKLYFAAGYYAGSAHMYQGGLMARVNADGTEFEILGEFLPDSFYILNNDLENIVGGKKLGRSYFSEDLALCYVKDADSTEEVLLTQEEYESLGMGGYSDYQEDNFWELSEVEVTGDKLFFTITTGKHDASQDIGWRYYYTREKTAVFCKDMKTGEICELYAY